MWKADIVLHPETGSRQKWRSFTALGQKSHTSLIGSLQTPDPRSGFTSGMISASSLNQWNSDSFFRLATCSRNGTIKTFNVMINEFGVSLCTAYHRILTALASPCLLPPLRQALDMLHFKCNRSIKDALLLKPPIQIHHSSTKCVCMAINSRLHQNSRLTRMCKCLAKALLCYF